MKSYTFFRELSKIRQLKEQVDVMFYKEEKTQAEDRQA